jgi:hypothetical protein
MRSAFTIVLVCLGMLSPGQVEKFTISAAPKPGQTVHYTATQDLSVEVSPDATADPPVAQTSPVPTMKVAGKTTLAFTETSGAPDPQGRATALLTYEQASADMSINGIPIPMAGTLPQLAGKTFTLIFGADGKVADVTAPPEMAAMLGPAKQFVIDMYKLVPVATLAVGETVTTPFSVPLPLPVPGSGPIVMDGQTKTTLVSVDADGAEHIAKCDQIVEAAMVPPPADPKPGTDPGMSVTMKMRGTGKLQFNVDRSVMKSNESETTLDGLLSIGGAASASPTNAKIHGVIKTTVTGKY